MANELFRQGDVLIVRVDDLPPGAKEQPKVKGGITLALGEATGHAHVLRGRRLSSYMDTRNRLFIRLAERAHVVHQEHDEIVLPIGVYEVRRQREYSPEAIRNVMD